MKATKLILSGSYKDSLKNVIDFENIEVVLPTTEEDIAFLHVRNRYLPSVIAADKKFDKAVDRIRQVFLEGSEKVEQEFSFFGKDIKEMASSELQDLATFYDFRKVPLPRTASLRSIRFTAYAEYRARIQRAPLPKEIDENMFADLEPLKAVHKMAERSKAPQTMTIEDMIKLEESKALDASLTLDQLKDIATKKNIPFAPNIGYDTLRAKLLAADS